MPTIAGLVVEQKKQWSALWAWTGHITHPWNQYVYFHRSVELKSSPARAVVRVSADALYTLYVNAHRVHQGPARCFPGHQSYDTLDITPLLNPGVNSITAIVHQFGAPTFFRVFRDASGFLLDGVIECDTGPVELHTPAGWMCKPATAWKKNVARNSIQLAFQEHFDADADPIDWMLPGFTPAESDGWKKPWAVGPVGTHPWLLMEPRNVPLLADHVEHLTAVVAEFRGENPRGYKVVDNVYTLVDPAGCKKETGLLVNPDAMLRDDDELTTINPPPEGQCVAATLDLGTYRTGHIILEIADATGDEFIDVLFSEEIEKSQLPLLVQQASSSKESQSLRYRCRPGAQQWESFHYLGMRYLLVVFRNVENKPLKIRRLAVRQVHTAFDFSGAFTCSDERLNQIWQVGRHTQLNCSFDAFVDCPWRELAMWWGDSRVQAQVAQFAFGDTSLFERGIRLIGQSQTPDGALHAHAPADIPRHRLPDFMMTWVATLLDHHQLTGRTDLVRECLPIMHRVFEFFAAHESAEHLVGGFEGYWMFLDWVPIFKGDYSAPFNLLYLQSLRHAGVLCRLVGAIEEALVYETKAQRVQASCEKWFYNETTHRWHDGHDAKTGKPVEQISQHTHTLAILLNLKPDSHQEIAREVLLKSARAKKTKVITASSFFYAYVLQALAVAGLRNEVVEIIRQKWGTYFLDLGATTFYEMWTVTIESRCHAWSSSPVYHLQQTVLGVNSTAPGWTKVRIAPVVETLEFARGTVPTPHGNLQVEWEKAGEDQLAVRVDIPPGIEAVFVAPGGHQRKLDTGASEFHT